MAMAMSGALDSENILAEILKRLPPKSLCQFNCVQKSWYHLIQSPYFKNLYSSSNRFIYMLGSQVNWGYDSVYVLYRMDPLLHPRYHNNNNYNYYNNNSSNSNSTYLHDLRPLLVFPNSRFSIFQFKCVKLGSKLYFYGLAFPPDDIFTTFYTMEEKDLMSIQPSEDNFINNFKHLLTKIKNPMHGKKLSPIIFVANNKLYVLSGCFVNTCVFEVFSPVHETWQVLPSPEDDAQEFHDYSVGVSYCVVEQEQMVYFATTSVLSSFNLQTHQWTILACFDTFITPEPFTFGQQLFRYISNPVIGNMAFGILPDGFVSYVCASRMTPRGEEFMQPYLAPDKAFLEVLRHSRFTYMSKECSTDYIVALQDSDGKQQLCIITFGCKPSDTTYYVALSFFGIPGDFYTSEDRHVHEPDVYTSYADEKAKDGGLIRRYFSAKFLYTKHFIISSPLSEIIETCFL